MLGDGGLVSVITTSRHGTHLRQAYRPVEGCRDLITCTGT